MEEHQDFGYSEENWGENVIDKINGKQPHN